MKKNNDMMVALTKIGELVTMTLDASEILKQVVAITADLMKVDVCSIYLYDDTESMLVLAATIGLRDNAVGKVRIKAGDGITGRAAKQGRVVAVEDVTLDKRNKYIPITGEEAYRSILSVPLKFHDENIGVINVQTVKPRIFEKNDKRLLKTIAHQVSGLIRNARLFESVLTAKKELEQAHERLIESEKMAALGRLSATLSHELRNPLAGLKGASQLLFRKTSDSDERKEYVTLILEEVERLGKIVDDLIHFAKPKVLNYKFFDANKVIENLLLLHSEDLSYKKIAVRKRLSKLPIIKADEDKFKQIVVNIMVNAMDAMPEGGELLVISSVTINEKTDIEVATFQFKDTGNGIADDVLGHVLEPFYTTKPDGVGLGLAVCKSIIEQHGGSISIRSGTQRGEPSGTLIIFEIPTNSEKKQ
ncbi:ATP-binding protein [Candidatus Latescibacterota bacterium]